LKGIISFGGLKGMRSIKLEKWKSPTPDGPEVEEDLLTVLNVLIGNKRPEEVPKGFDPFRLMARINKAFIKADETGTLVLEETEYAFLKQMVEKDVPSVWGMNKNICKAVEAFLEAKE
jgi:hypothetical protein